MFKIYWLPCLEMGLNYDIKSTPTWNQGAFRGIGLSCGISIINFCGKNLVTVLAIIILMIVCNTYHFWCKTFPIEILASSFQSLLWSIKSPNKKHDSYMSAHDCISVNATTRHVQTNISFSDLKMDYTTRYRCTCVKQYDVLLCSQRPYVYSKCIRSTYMHTIWLNMFILRLSYVILQVRPMCMTMHE